MGGFIAHTPNAKADTSIRKEKRIGASGLPLPRFVSLKYNRAIVRSGPRRHYPQLWEYRRTGLPLEIIDEYGLWRRVRDYDGDEGWMAAQLFKDTRTVILGATPTSHAIRRAPHSQAGILSFAQADVIAYLLQCEKGWCKIRVAQAEEIEGWLPAHNLWGIYDFEAISFTASD